MISPFVKKFNRSKCIFILYYERSLLLFDSNVNLKSNVKWDYCFKIILTVKIFRLWVRFIKRWFYRSVAVSQSDKYCTAVLENVKNRRWISAQFIIIDWIYFLFECT